jgi:hypothetical protein
VRVGGLSSAALAGSSAEARLHAGPPEKGGPDASSAEPPMPAQIDSVSGIIWEDYGRRSNEAKEPIRRSVAPLAVPPWQRDPEPPVWLSSNNLAGNAVNNPVYAGVRKAPVAGHNSGAISLLQGGSGRLFTPEGHLYTAEAKATSLNSLKPQPDGSGHLNDVIFADYGQTPDVEVARVNFSRPGKRTTSHSSRMRGTSFDFIGNNYQPEVRVRHSVWRHGHRLWALCTPRCPWLVPTCVLAV